MTDFIDKLIAMISEPVRERLDAAMRSLAPAPRIRGSKINTAKQHEERKERILVIRLGALGDIILCFQAFSDIKHAYGDEDEIVILTTPAFADFAKRMPWFSKVILDPRAKANEFSVWSKLLKEIRKFRPTRIYDLQGKLRQTALFTLLGGPFASEWSGAAPLCSHPRLSHPQPGMHFTDYVAAQLQLADVPQGPKADVSWLDDPLEGFKLPEKFAVLVPGSVTRRQYKRWPAENYAALAKILKERGLGVIAVGGKQDSEVVGKIRALAPFVEDYTNRTNLFQLAGLLRRANCVVANDTGPMHIAATVGTPTLGLMSERVDASWSAPHGPRVKWLQGRPLTSLSVEKVLLALDALLEHND